MGQPIVNRLSNPSKGQSVHVQTEETENSLEAKPERVTVPVPVRSSREERKAISEAKDNHII
jgi:actin-like ATPase involved in cell morphogenesis